MARRAAGRRAGSGDRPITAATPAARLPAFASTSFRIFLAGAFVSNIGSWMQGTAQGWLVLRLTDSPAALGVASFAGMIPVLLLSLYAGVLADRRDRRTLLLWSQVGAGAFAAILALLITTGHVVYWHVVVLALLGGAAGAFGMPAFQALVPALVKRDDLGNAIALNSAQFNLSRVLGPAAAGLLLGTLGESASFWINALSFVALIVALRWVRVSPEEEMSRPEVGMWTHLVDGLRYVSGQRELLALLLLSVAPGLLIMPYGALLPLYARDVLGIGAAGLGLLTAAVGVGALVGALSVALTRSIQPSGRVLVGGLVAAAASAIVFAVSRQALVSVAALAVLGGSSVAYYTSTNTLVQWVSPARLRGRILSIYTLTSIGSIPVGSLIAGALAESIGAPTTLVGGAILSVLSLFAVVIWCPQILHLGAGQDAAPPPTAALQPLARRPPQT